MSGLHIEALTWQQAVRSRRELYVDDVDGLVELVVRDAINRGAWSIEISLEGAWATVVDDAPASFEDFVEPPGCGLSAARVSALADRMIIELHDDSCLQTLELAAGEPRGDIRDHGASEWTGCRVCFRADPAIFGGASFDRAELRESLRTLCAFHPSLSVILDGEDLSQPRGLAGEVARVVGTPLHARPLRFAGNRHDVQIDVALQWGQTGQPSVRCFDERLVSKGPNQAFWLGLLDAARRSGINDEVVEELLRPGLVAVVSIARDSDALDSATVAEAVREVTREGLGAHKRVLDRVIAIRSRSTLGA